MTEHKVTIERVTPDSMVVDERVQRALSEGKVGRLVSTLNPSAIGVPVLSRRANGDLVILDGQHRIMALIRSGLGANQINCQIHDGLSIPAEAGLFLQYNDRHLVNTLERFRLAVTAGHSAYVKLDNIITFRGFRVSPGLKNSLTCVQTLFSVYRAGAQKGQDGRADVVDATLQIIVDAWGHDGTAIRETVAGIGGVVGRCNGNLDHDRLVHKLASLSGGPNGIRAQARTRYDMGTAKSVVQGAEQAVVDIYNTGLRKDKLEMP